MRTVLFVDNDKTVLRSIERCLLDEHYHKLFAKGGKETLDILQRERVHVIVTDIRMPGIDGHELLRIVGKMYPHIVKIVLSGYTDMSALLTEFDQGEIFRFVPKPWKLDKDFITVIRQAIDYYNLENKGESLTAGVEQGKTKFKE
jgi:DNA-binding NtrC family response regulator